MRLETLKNKGRTFIKRFSITIFLLVLIIQVLAIIRYAINSKNNDIWTEFLESREINTDFEDEYYYNQLNTQEQKIYKKIFNAFCDISNFEEGLQLPEIIPNKIMFVPKLKRFDDIYTMLDLLSAIECDNEKLIWVHDGNILVCDVGIGFIISMHYWDSLDTTEEVINGFNELDEFMKNKIEPVIGFDTAEENELAVYKVVKENMIRDSKRDGKAYQSIYGIASDKKVVCAATAKTLKYIDKQYNLGLDCICVTGKMSINNGTGSHMWNIVKINNKYKLVDIINYINLLKHEDYIKKDIYYDYDSQEILDINRRI